MEKTEIAGADSIGFQAGGIHRLDGEPENFGFRRLGTLGRVPFNSSLIEFGRIEPAGITGLEAKSGAGIAITRLPRDILRMGQVIAAGRHGEIGPKTEFPA